MLYAKLMLAANELSRKAFKRQLWFQILMSLRYPGHPKEWCQSHNKFLSGLRSLPDQRAIFQKTCVQSRLLTIPAMPGNCWMEETLLASEFEPIQRTHIFHQYCIIWLSNKVVYLQTCVNNFVLALFYHMHTVQGSTMLKSHKVMKFPNGLRPRRAFSCWKTELEGMKSTTSTFFSGCYSYLSWERVLDAPDRRTLPTLHT